MHLLWVGIFVGGSLLVESRGCRLSDLELQCIYKHSGNSCISPKKIVKSGWWFHFFYFHPENWGDDSHFDEHFFQMGWFNHQLGIVDDFGQW